MVKVYGFPGSTCTRKVLCTLHEKGAAFEFVNVDITKGEQKSPAHLARQPFGVVPAIDHDGFALYESRAIIRYLDRRAPGREPHARRREAARPHGAVDQRRGLVLHAPRDEGRPQHLVRVHEGRAARPGRHRRRPRGHHHRPRQPRQGPAGKDFLCGAFSLADICYAPYLQYLFDMRIALGVTDRPNVAAWWGRVSERPAWQKAISQKP